MSKGWKRTDLVMGEDLTLPDEMFSLPKVVRPRIEYCVYAGETETGIIVEIKYKKTIGNNGATVQKFIDFAAIWSGKVKIYRRGRIPVTVERKNPLDMAVKMKSGGCRYVDGVLI